MSRAPRWEFWIDRGGTFTDCIARSPDGGLHSAKLLSSDEAPALAVRSILEAQGVVAPGAPLPACSVKLGSTVATNALLERRGARTALVTHAALGDVFTIGTQERPELFALAIRRPPPRPRVGGRGARARRGATATRSSRSTGRRPARRSRRRARRGLESRGDRAAARVRVSRRWSGSSRTWRGRRAFPT